MNWLRKLATGVVTVAITLALIGCNTAEGAGRDIERAGEEIQEEAEEGY